MTKEHNLWGESAEGLKSWLLTTQVWAPLSLSGIVELPYTLFTGSKSNLSWFLSRKIGKYIGS